MRRDVAAGQEAHADCSCLLDKLGLRVACLHAELHDFLRTPSPTFDQPPAIEDASDKWVARP